MPFVGVESKNDDDDDDDDILFGGGGGDDDDDDYDDDDAPISGLYPFLTPKCTLSYPKQFVDRAYI